MYVIHAYMYINVCESLFLIAVCWTSVGDEEAVKKCGKMRQQGKKYVVVDGDIIYFKFNT